MGQGAFFPDEVKKYFWGDDLEDLKWKNHRDYIVTKIMENGDEKAVKWLLNTVDKKTLRSLLPNAKLSNKSANFWSVYLS